MSDLQEYTLAEFLVDRSTNFSTKLPLVHSTESANIWNIIDKEIIEVSLCDTFKNENLTYFFHGRPAYRKFISNPMEWELPFVLILNSTCIVNVKRVFPFDTGAFNNNILPRYLHRYSKDGYEISENKNAVDLIIDIFFGDDETYFCGNAKPRAEVMRRNRLNMRHAQIMALCALYNREQLEGDDRSLAIEFQSDDNVTVKDDILGVILPRPYYDDGELKKYFKKGNIILKHYDIYPINTESYMALIYTEVKNIYTKLGILDA